MKIKPISKYTRIAIGLAAIGALCVAVSLVAYWLRLHELGLSNSSSDWGSFGDFIGGFAGTIVSLITLIALACTLHLQAVELADTSDALRDQAKSMNEQLQLARIVELRRIRPIVTLNWKRHRSARLSLTMKNVGLGPAIVDKLVVVHPSNKTKAVTRGTLQVKKFWGKIIKASMPGGEHMTVAEWDFSVQPVRDLLRGLAVGESQAIFSIIFKQEEAIKHVLPSLRRNVSLVIHFRSLAGQSLSTDAQYELPPIFSLEEGSNIGEQAVSGNFRFRDHAAFRGDED